ASNVLGAWRLSGCTLYVTLEPCLMCAGAIYQSRVDEVIYGAVDAKAGACGSLYRIHEDARLNHRFLVSHGVLESESREMLQKFFRRRRQGRDGRVAEGARLEI
ncbi:MAG: nucleoside deaminase, partial [Proteobacteria bacterium]|nr:nucleoside deaminase [Pseudomonadota bacterium]